MYGIDPVFDALNAYRKEMEEKEMRLEERIDDLEEQLQQAQKERDALVREAVEAYLEMLE